MFRFTTRDLLWLMVVVAVSLAWCTDRSAINLAWHQLANKKVELAGKELQLQARLRSAETQVLRGQQDRERLEEAIREKQLQIEQLLTAPSKPHPQEP